MGFSVRKEVPILKNPVDKKTSGGIFEKTGKHTDELD